jgi:hypothetical protein
MKDLPPQRAFFVVSTFWTVGASGVLSGVVMSIVGLSVLVGAPSQPKWGATNAQQTTPSIETRSSFRVIRVPLTRVVGMKQVKTKIAIAHRLYGEDRNLLEQKSFKTNKLEDGNRRAGR